MAICVFANPLVTKSQCSFTTSITGPTLSCGPVTLTCTSSPGDTWTQKADYGGGGRSFATAFSIGSKGYVGLGYNSTTNYTSDFWEYDPLADTWTQKANYGGGPRIEAVGFSIGNKGYAGLGFMGSNQNDFWEYDPSANTWTQKASFAGSARTGATGFSIGNKGYLGLGNDGTYKNDLWEYDPVADTWTQKANFGGTPRSSAPGFAVAGKGYVGTGLDGSLTNDFWEYDPATNVWTQKTNFGGTARYGAVGFSISNRAYIGLGFDGAYAADFWEYSPTANAWTQKGNFSGTTREFAVTFSIGGKGYIGTGRNLTVRKQDFWEYDPSRTYLWSTAANSNTALINSSGSYSVLVTNVASGCTAVAVQNVSIPSPTLSANSGSICSGQTFTISPGGASTYTISGGSSAVSPTATTSYSISGTATNGCVSQTPAVSTVSVYANPTLNVTSNQSVICIGESVTIVGTGALNYTWSASSATSPTVVLNPTVTTSYTVTGVNAAGCIGKTIFTQSVDLCARLTEPDLPMEIISIYPNPNQGEFLLELSKAGRLIIFNFLGETAFDAELNTGRHKIVLPANNEGIYFAYLLANGKKYSIKVVQN